MVIQKKKKNAFLIIPPIFWWLPSAPWMAPTLKTIAVKVLNKQQQVRWRKKTKKQIAAEI